MTALRAHRSSDAARSGIIDVLTESCPTKILLQNPEAREDNSREFYMDLGRNAQLAKLSMTGCMVVTATI
ncbi:hypothetical protein [Hoeflea sp.]|uniref:hypothetical protein n=1 Tax=Hoeflea sp. TaxID=1940281 RepID=UPI003B014899